MPWKPRHACNKPGCRVLTASRFCEEHAKQAEREYQAQRGTATERGYGGRWAKVRAIKLGRDPLCERCTQEGKVIAAVLVHHKDRNPRNNADGNLESLCDGCHAAEHKSERWTGRPDGGVKVWQ